ncbi:hypothetical protein V7P28_31740 [Klebsiella michiganensis]
MEAWISGNGCVPIYGLMEDAATADNRCSRVNTESASPYIYSFPKLINRYRPDSASLIRRQRSQASFSIRVYAQ